MWDKILAILVMVHLATEYIHYILEYVWGKRDDRALHDILKHRKLSRKTPMLKEILKDLDLIKDKLEIRDSYAEDE